MRQLFLLFAIGFQVSLFAQINQPAVTQQGEVTGRQLTNPTSQQDVPPHRTCGTMEVDALIRAEDPAMGTMEDFEEWLQLKMAQESGSAATVYTLPVIVHVIHSGEPQGNGSNISAAQVQSQIDVLNEDFRRMNADTANTPAAYQPVAADVEIEFCLATVDQQGQVLTQAGIHRVSRNSMGFSSPPYSSNYINNVIKPATIWDPNKYLNIWVLDIGGGILGYAQFPVQSGLPGLPTTGSANTDGIVVGYRYFGRGGFPQLASPYHLGRTATHEIGHWLGLRHIWGDGGCGSDDHCNDTPLAGAPNYGCQTSAFSCGSADMVENYMDYSDDACFNLFTEDQKVRMRTVLDNSPRRKELKTSIVCNPDVPPVADFTADVFTIYSGGQVRFTDLSQGNPTQWAWQFPGGSPATSSLQNPQITYLTPGTYPVTLTATNPFGSDVITKTSYITVLQATDCDTLNFPPPGQLAFYTVGGEPIIGWNTNFEDQSKAQYFNNYQPYNYITGGIFFFSLAHKSPGSNATVTFAMWDNTGPNGNPGQILDSVTVDLGILQQIVNNGSLVQMFFDEPVEIPGNFYFGFMMNDFTPLDSLGLVSNESGSSPGGLAWEQWSDGTWHPLDSIYTLGGNPFEVSLFASPLATQEIPFASFTASETSVCLGETITFQVDSSQPGNSYTWVFPGGTPEVAFSDSVVVTYDSAGTHSVLLIVDGGCATSDDTLAVGLIEVNTIPSIDSFTTVPASCGGMDGSATPIISGGAPPFTYEWDAGTGFQNTATADSLAPGTYQLFIEDSKGCQDFGFVDVGTADAPVGSVQNVQEPSCFNGNDGSATVSATQGTPPYVFDWPGGATGSTQGGLAAGSYLVTVTDDNNCTSEFTVVVTEPDSIVATASATNESCQGNDGTVTASVTGGTPPYTYAWSNGGSGNPLAGLSAGTYTVTVTDSEGCTDTASATVNPAANITISFSNVQDAGCTDDNGTATASASGGNGPYAYAWSGGQTGAAPTTLSSGTHIVTVTDVSNCTGVDSVVIGFTDDLNATSGPNMSICAGSSVQITAIGGSNYLWAPAPVSGQGTATATVAPTSTTTYTCVVQLGVCSDTVEVTVTVNANPIVTIDEGDTLEACENEQVTLHASGAISYDWSPGGTGLSTSFTATQSGLVWVEGTDANGCSGSDTIMVVVDSCIGVGKKIPGLEVQVYPNPASQTVFVALEVQAAASFSLVVYDPLGRTVHDAQLDAAGTQTHAIPVNNWAAGVYQVVIRGDNGAIQRSFTVTR